MTVSPILMSGREDTFSLDLRSLLDILSIHYSEFTKLGRLASSIIQLLLVFIIITSKKNL